jgi:hypothetical protein
MSKSMRVKVMVQGRVHATLDFVGASAVSYAPLPPTRTSACSLPPSVLAMSASSGPHLPPEIKMATLFAAAPWAATSPPLGLGGMRPRRSTRFHASCSRP